MKERWDTRRKAGIEKLGGKCVKCGATERLDFDHVDPSTKSFTIGRKTSCSEKLFEEELAKCQLLCKTCHEEKSLTDRETVSAKSSHGTLSSYRYCKCDVCKAAKAKYSKEWKARNKLLKGS